jgi:hypothetical protein
MFECPDHFSRPGWQRFLLQSFDRRVQRQRQKRMGVQGKLLVYPRQRPQYFSVSASPGMPQEIS